MAALDLEFLASARDVRTAVSRNARAEMSGMPGMSLLYPQLVQGGRLVHLTSNFAANNPIDRAIEIVELGGLLAIKAHAVKQAFGFTAVDGLDEHYSNYLDVVLSFLEDRYGEELWWTSMDEITKRVLSTVRETTGALPSPSPCPLPRGGEGTSGSCFSNGAKFR
jgi:hypothetical protein